MIKVAIYDWEGSLRKIDLTNFLKDEKQIGLKRAKETVDDFLEGISFDIVVADELKLEELLKNLDEFNLVFSVIKTNS